MGLVISTGGAGAQFGGGLGAGFAKGTEDRIEREREDQLLEQARQEKQAIADEMVGAVSQEFASQAGSVREGIPEIDPGTATIGPAGLPMYLNPGPNPDLEGHDEWVGQHMRVLQSMKSPEAADLYKQSLAQELDRTIRARATKRFNGTLKSAVDSGAMSQEEAAVFIDQLATTGDVASTYNDFNDFRAEKVKAGNRTRRGLRRVEQAGQKAEFLSQSPDEWERSKSEEIADLVGRMQVDGEWGDEDIDYEAFEAEYQDILDRPSPTQKHKLAMEMEAFKQEGRAAREQRTELMRALGVAMEENEKEVAASLMGKLNALDAAPAEGGTPPLIAALPPGTPGAPAPAFESSAPQEATEKSTVQMPKEVTQGTILQGVNSVTKKLRSAGGYATPSDLMADAQELRRIALEQWGVEYIDQLPAKVQGHFKALEQEVLKAFPELAPQESKPLPFPVVE